MRADGAFAAPAFQLVAIFIGVVLTPITLYLHLAHPDWSWMYLVDPDDIPGLAIVPVLVGLGGAVVVGWTIGARLVRAGKDRAALYGLLGAAAVALLSVPICWRRLGAYGTHADYHGGVAHDLWDVKLGYVLVGLVIGVGAAAGYVGLELLRDSRRVRTR